MICFMVVYSSTQTQQTRLKTLFFFASLKSPRKTISTKPSEKKAIDDDLFSHDNLLGNLQISMLG